MTDLNLITVAEIGQFAPDLDTSSYDAVTLSGMISGASKQVSDYLGYSPLAEDIVGENRKTLITNEGDILLHPVKTPIQRIDSLSIVKGTATLVISLTNDQSQNRYQIDFNKRSARVAYSQVTLQGSPVLVDIYSIRGASTYTTMSYRGGFEVSELPQTIKMATLLYLRDTLSLQVNSSGATRISQGGISLEFTARMGKSKFIQDAEKLLQSYRRNV